MSRPPRCRIFTVAWLTVLLSGAVWAKAPVGGVPTTAEGLSAPVLDPTSPRTGTFGPGDVGLQDLVAGNDGDVTFADAYSYLGAEADTVTVSVSGTVPIYLALLAPDGELLAGSGTQGDDLAPSLQHTLPETGSYHVVVNSFHGDAGSYTLAIQVGDEVDGSMVVLSEPVPLALGVRSSGELGPGDAPLSVLVAGNAGDETWSDEYVFEARSGEGFVVVVNATVPVYLALLDAERQLVSGDGTQGESTRTRVVWVPSDDERFQLVVNSFHGQQGSYTLELQPADRADLEELSAALPVDGTVVPGSPVSDVIVPSERIFRTWVVDVPPGSTTLAIETSSEHNIDLFVRHGLQIISSWNTEPDFAGVSDGGNEVVRVNQFSDPPLQPGRYYVDVVRFTPEGERAASPSAPFTLSATVTQTVIPVVIDVAPVNTENMVTGMFAAQLTPERRVTARIEPNISPLQVWTVHVPPGSERLEVRTYAASGRLDVVATPPGINLPNDLSALLTAPFRAVTAQDNERLVVDASSTPPLVPGSYTVAVLDLYSDAASDYEIAVSLDEELPAQAPWTPPAESELAELTPLQQAVRATVQLTLSLEEGGLEFGSGSIVAPDGLILTNHHVIGHCAHSSPHLLGCVGDVYRGADGTGLNIYVGLSSEHESSAEQFLVARVVRSLPDYDLALLQVVSDVEGRPFTGQLPTVPIATGLDEVELGDPVSVIGYPGVAGLGSRISLSMTRGFVTGFTDDRGHRVFVNVDANIAGGNSGGALVDDDGVLVGVPSNQNLIRERGERQDYARSLNLLPPEWLDLLRAHGAELQ